MSYAELNSIFVRFSASLKVTKLTSILAIRIFNNFPEKLPRKFKEPHEILVEFFPEVFGDYEDTKKEEESQFTKNTKREIFDNLLNLLDVKDIVDRDSIVLLRRINYKRLLLSQQLIMYFAHLDAVLLDLFKQVCLLSPSLLKRDKQISFIEVYDNKDNVTNLLLGKLATEFNYKSLEEKLNFFTEEMKIDINLNENNVLLLTRAEQIRHIYVHNAGKIDSNFLKKTRIRELKEGDMYPLDEELNEKVYEIIEYLIIDINDKIIEKFNLVFEITEGED